jgi:hypothetical protein
VNRTAKRAIPKCGASILPISFRQHHCSLSGAQERDGAGINIYEWWLVKGLEPLILALLASRIDGDGRAKKRF